MFAIEQRGREWAVVNDDTIVSVHPIRGEAERAVLWLAERSVPRPHQALLLEDLTPRELDVLQRINQRGTYAEVGRDLFVSTNTIKTHVRSIFAKLGVTDRDSAVAAATVLGLLDDFPQADGDAANDPEDGMAFTARAARDYLSGFAEGLRSHDWAAYARSHRGDARQVAPLMTCEGIDAIIEFNRRVSDAIPDLRVEATHVTIDPNANRAIIECLQVGTLTGPVATANGVIPATGKRFQIESVHVVAFDRAGLVSEVRRYWDLHEVLRQQGVSEQEHGA